MTRSAARCWRTRWVLLLLAGCHRELVGEGEGEGSEDEGPWAFCDAAALADPPAEAGACPGIVPAGEPDAMQAESIFGRTIHEAGHIAEVVRRDDGDAGLFEREGDDIRAGSDSGYVIGRVAREDGSARLCVALSFACWTGGHGGFGPSALDGRADVLVDGDVAEVRGELGLVEGGALSGAPSAEVWGRIEAANAEGFVGEYEF